MKELGVLKKLDPVAGGGGVGEWGEWGEWGSGGVGEVAEEEIGRAKQG